MSMTFEELKEALSEFDEITLLELLEVDSWTLVGYLTDVIEEKQDELRNKIEEIEEDD